MPQCGWASGIASVAVAMGLGLTKVPRAALALHLVVALMGLAVVRIVCRMTYEHARSRVARGSRMVRIKSKSWTTTRSEEHGQAA